MYVCVCFPTDEGNGLQLSFSHTLSKKPQPLFSRNFFQILYLSRTLLCTGTYFILLLVLCCGVLFCRSFISNFPFVRNGRTLLKFFCFIIIIKIYFSPIFHNYNFFNSFHIPKSLHNQISFNLQYTHTHDTSQQQKVFKTKE